MQYIKLGNTGLEVSRLCIGTMTFGLQTNREEAFKILDEAAIRNNTVEYCRQKWTGYS